MRRRFPTPWLLLLLLALCLGPMGCGGEAPAQAAGAEPAGPRPMVLDVPPDRDQLPTRSQPEGAPPASPVEAPQAQTLPAPHPAPEPAHAELRRKVERAVVQGITRANQRSQGRVHGNNAVVAVHVVDLASGEVLLARLADSSLLPASNLKLITLAAALAELGADHELLTPVEAHGPVAGGVLQGDLVLRAAGDPLYRPEGQGELDPWVEPLAAELRAAGIERVSGDLVLDEGGFPAPGPGPAWPSSKEHWKEYCALAGGFSVNAGCLSAIVEATSPGELARVRVLPLGHGLERRGQVKTGPRRKALTVAVGAVPGRVTVRGTLPADVPRYEARFAAPDPVELFGRALRHGLGRHGIQVDGELRRARVEARREPVAHLRSPLADTVVPILRDSNNSVADQVFLHLAHAQGQEPTRAGGEAAVVAALERLGVPRGGLVQVDGSGLSKANRTSPRQLTALLRAALARIDAEARTHFRTALPVAGESGSLRRRMRSGPARGRVRAKTGFVNGASGLSGLAETLDGRTLAFSILVNYPHVDGLNTHAFKPMQDAICEALVQAPPGPGSPEAR